MKLKDLVPANTVAVSPSSSVAAVARRMRELRLAAILVSERGRLIGIVTDHDIVTRGVASCRDVSTMLASEVMSSSVVTCQVEDDVETAARTMEQRRIRHLAVLDSEHHLVGLVSLAAVSQALPPARVGELLMSLSAELQ